MVSGLLFIYLFKSVFGGRGGSGIPLPAGAELVLKKDVPDDQIMRQSA
jgi:hypothetical protein